MALPKPGTIYTADADANEHIILTRDRLDGLRVTHCTNKKGGIRL